MIPLGISIKKCNNPNYRKKIFFKYKNYFVSSDFHHDILKQLVDTIFV